MSNIATSKLDIGMITVAYRRVDGEWRCTALQFDIVGTGQTREAAFEELSGLVTSHLNFVSEQMAKKQKVALFNPSAAEEWEVEDKEEYNVLVNFTKKKNEKALVAKSIRMSDWRTRKIHIQGLLQA